jgi:hypothetical protein
VAEPIVPAPVSLIERCIRAIRVGYGDVIHPDLLAELRALLSQPTPTEVEVEGSFFAVADLPATLARHMRALDEANRREKQHWIEHHEPSTPAAAPPSTADMPIGTTFTRTGDQWTVTKAGAFSGRAMVKSPEATIRYLDEIDPSTIRDVTPPKEAPRG